jgi:thiamine biosynthesis lipoprotein
VQKLLTLLLVFLAAQAMAQKDVHRTEKLMGCRFDFTIVADDDTRAERFIEMAIAEIQRIERLISSWDEHSQTSEVIRQAGVHPVKVDKELFDLIQRSIKLSELSSGAFDISFASMDRIWKFDGSMTKLPTPEEIRASVAKVGYQNIILNSADTTVFLKNEGMRIGFGAIGKGYAADRAKELLQAEGVTSAIVNASGDLNAWGSKADGTDWLVAITNPLNKEKAFAWLPVKNSAVVTSGNYEKYALIDGQRYSHIIDPRTGYPSQGISSVSIFAPKAELADALATAVFIMGVEVGVDLIDQLPDIECVIVDADNKIHTSKNIQLDHEE